VGIHDHKLHEYPPIRVGDVDHRGGRVLLRDTKNRSDHKLPLSRQAIQIAKRNCADRKADKSLFPIVDTRKTLSCTNEDAGTKVQGHGLRATFASFAEELVSSSLLKRMMNHAAAGDVTLGRYVAKSAAQLRAGWQAVADFVEEAAGRE
jgi:integrase